MKNRVQHAGGALAAALLAAACGTGKTAPVGKPGQVKLRLDSEMRGNPGAVAALPAICADFTLTPYSLDAGGTPTAAGQPVSVSNTAQGGGTAAIVGCIDTLSSPANDWSYIVTATNFHTCDGSALPAGSSISPLSVSTAYNFDCIQGQDVSANIVVNVSIAQPNQAGYVDISVSVNATTVEVGCKTAGFDDPANPNSLHFAESYTWAGNAEAVSAVPDGLWGLSQDPTRDSVLAPSQWAGQVHQGSLNDQYYTGAVSLPSPTHIVQTFVPRGCTGNYLASNHPECITDADPGHQTATTIAKLADAFIANSTGWAAVSIVDAHTFNITTGRSFSAIPSGPAPHANTPAFSTTLLPVQTVSDPTASIRSIHPAANGYQFVVILDDGSGALYWALYAFNPATSQWGPPTSAHHIQGVTPELATCLGLYGLSDGCYPVNNCDALIAASDKSNEARLAGGIRESIVTRIPTFPGTPGPVFSYWQCSGGSSAGSSCSCTGFWGLGSTHTGTVSYETGSRTCDFAL